MAGNYVYDAPEVKKVKKVTKSPLGDRTEYEIVPQPRPEMVAGVPVAVPKPEPKKEVECSESVPVSNTETA